ncbi:MAG: P-loop NTPase fold protein [Lachnospiraceae bacterium]
MERRDIPVSTLEEDEFEIGKYVNSLCKFIRNCDTPITIALQGEWGCGKSSFMKILESCLCAKSLPEDQRYESIWLNTWDLFLENDYEEAVKKLVLSLLSQIEEHFEQLNKNRNEEKRKAIIREYLKNISGMMLNATNLSGDYSDKLLENVFVGKGDTGSVRKVKRELESFICKEIEEENNGVTNKAFLIFVDDLDRLEPKMAVTLLEALKNLFDIQKCIFILAIDYDVVANGISQKFGEKRLANRNIEKDFFDKLIQVPYTIPMSQYNIAPMVMRRLRLMRFFEKDYNYGTYQEIVVDIVRYATNKNPRAIKRLINMLQLMIEIDMRETTPHPSFRVMELLLMALQLSFPKVYLMIARNWNLDTWKKSFHLGEHVNEIPAHIKKQYMLDEEWKEIIYLAVTEDEVIQHNYYRVAKLLEIYEEVQNRCLHAGEKVEDVLGIVNVISHQSGEEVAVSYDGQAYNESSQTQFKQGEHLIDSLDFGTYCNVLDVGCGSGKTTIEMWNRNRNMQITAFDIAPSQIEKAMENYEEAIQDEAYIEYRGWIEFLVKDALTLDKTEQYDLIFSNATMHWITEPEKMYGLLYTALRSGGQLAIHQGGFGTYSGLHKAVQKAISNLGMKERFKNWIFPAYYPQKDEIKDLLEKVGFVDVQVESVYSDEKDNDKLVENFSNASLIFYKKVGLSEEEYDCLKQEFFNICEKEDVDKSSHRLYIYAKKQENG